MESYGDDTVSQMGLSVDEGSIILPDPTEETDSYNDLFNGIQSQQINYELRAEQIRSYEGLFNPIKMEDY